MNNEFDSVDPAQELQDQYNLKLVDTFKQNKQEIPTEMSNKED